MNEESERSALARILIIDDDVSVSNLIEQCAQDAGHEVHSVNATIDIARRFKELNPDLIFLDLDLVDKDGIEVMQFLSIENCTAKIVIMSGLDEVARESSRLIGIQMNLNVLATLKKPFPIDALKEFLGDRE